MRDPLLRDGTPLVRQYTSWSYVNGHCTNVGDEAEIRLAIGRIVNVRLCEAVDGSLWLMVVSPSHNSRFASQMAQERARLMPAIHLLSQIADLDSSEVFQVDTEVLRGFKRFKNRAKAAGQGLKELL